MASSDKKPRNSNPKKLSEREANCHRAIGEMQDLDDSWERFERLRAAAAPGLPGLEAIAACCGDCGTDGCPDCLDTFRLDLVERAYKLKLDTGMWTSLTIIPEGGLVERPEDFDLEAFVKRIRKRLERSSLRNTIILGGVDVSRNLFENRVIGWQFHLHALINERDTGGLRKAVKATFPPEPTAHLPYGFSEVEEDGFFTCLSYGYKAVFWRRSGYWYWDTRDGSEHRNARYFDLRRDELIELYDWLAQHPLGARLVMRGVRRQSPPGAPKLKLARTLPMVKRSGAVVEVPEKKG